MNIMCAHEGASPLRKPKAVNWRGVTGILRPTRLDCKALRDRYAGVITVYTMGVGSRKVEIDNGGSPSDE